MSSIRSAEAFVESLSRPGGNATGFLLFEYTTSGKLVELLKQIAPSVTRAAILRDIGTAAGSGQLGAIQSAASQLGVENSVQSACATPERSSAA
jgi:putative ABC transport system substrate-binding protein